MLSEKNENKHKTSLGLARFIKKEKHTPRVMVMAGVLVFYSNDPSSKQCDQIGRFFALWVTIQIIWQQ